MKTIFFLMFLSLGILQATEWTTELRAGYFYPTSNLLRKIYHYGGVEGEIESTGAIDEDWQGWGNVGYFARKGRSLGLGDKTRVSIVPISAGVKYLLWPCECIRPYVGAGIAYTYLNTWDDSDFVRRHVKKGTIGFVIKSGAYVDLSCNFFLDCFLDYYYQRMNFHSDPDAGVQRHSVDVGGFKAGVGLGYAF